MSRAHGYHQPDDDAADSCSDESDSDIELAIQELDPHTSSYGNGEYDYRHKFRGGMGGLGEGQIPLRNLHPTHTSAGRQKHAVSGEDEDAEHDENDSHKLVHESVNSNDSAASFIAAEDNAPLLDHKRSTDSDPRTSKTTKYNHSSFSHLSYPIANIFRGSYRRHQEAHKTKNGASRSINIGQYQSLKFPPNAVSNAKYNAWSFLPLTLYNEFSFFYNLYFLLVALSQIIPSLRIGYLSTYVAPLVFVLMITLGKEALDDIGRRRRDAEANKEEYSVLRLQDTTQRRPNQVTRKMGSRMHSNNAKGKSLSSKRTRLDAIEEEEESMGTDHADFLSDVQMDEIKIKARDLSVGDILKLGKDQRVPADLVILKSYTTESAITVPSPRPSTGPSSVSEPHNSISEEQSATEAGIAESNSGQTGLSKESHASTGVGVGETFLRTDQLDGETDWKLRLASPFTQSLDPRSFTRINIVAAKPDKKVHEFFGTIEYTPHESSGKVSSGNNVHSRGAHTGTQTAPLTIDNTAWANTILASNSTVLAVVVYTGAQTRQAMSTSTSRSKTGLLDHEINNLSKILCAFTLSLSIILVILEGVDSRKNHEWYVAIMRFLILFSTIIPISLRVNLDMGKTIYARFIERDQGIPGTVVRTSTIPEELGRIEYLLSDKTGTLTQNGMLGIVHTWSD